MTVEELNNPVTHISSDGTIYNIVFVLNHKTFASHGPCAVPFGENTWIQLHNYLKFVRPQSKPKAPHKHLVSLNANGKMISKPGQAVMKITKKHERHITTTKVRHCIAT
jgi:site-specific recombinase XerD